MTKVCTPERNTTGIPDTAFCKYDFQCQSGVCGSIKGKPMQYCCGKGNHIDVNGAKVCS